jgi:hypothetical protein
MSSLARVFFNVTALFCSHEWARRVDGRRVYLECVHCLSTTPGVDLGRAPKPGAPSGSRRQVKAVQAV